MSEKRELPVVESAGKSSKSSCCGPAAADPCCGEAPVARGKEARVEDAQDVRSLVRERYGAVAEGRDTACCGSTPPDQVLGVLGYTAEQAAAIPEGANLGLGCGNPIGYAALQPGEVALDLGSGAGIDCFLAAREVGPTGRAIGVDMTPSMLERARRNAVESNIRNVEFRLGEIEHLPIADVSVDCIISNCVINLSPDKPQVFREAYRALRPGGRILVSDLVLLRPLSEELRQNVALYVGCVAGAASREQYLSFVEEAGFSNVEVVAEARYTVGADHFAEGSPEREAFEAVSSVKVRAIKPLG